MRLWNAHSGQQKSGACGLNSCGRTFRFTVWADAGTIQLACRTAPVSKPTVRPIGQGIVQALNHQCNRDRGLVQGFFWRTGLFGWHPAREGEQNRASYPIVQNKRVGTLACFIRIPMVIFLNVNQRQGIQESDGWKEVHLWSQHEVNGWLDYLYQRTESQKRWLRRRSPLIRIYSTGSRRTDQV